jgi:hypothetical protein
MNEPKTQPRQAALLSVSVALSIAAGISPEVTHRWFYRVPTLMEATLVLGPLLFVPFTIAAYYYSGRNKLTLLLWLLAPLCFRRLLEFLLAGLLWTLRGGMV